MTGRATLTTAVAALAIGIMCRPAYAIPDASTPVLLGGTLGAEAGVVGTDVNKGIPYYIYGTVSAIHLVSVKGEILNGHGRPNFKSIGAQVEILPLPFVTLVAEPGLSWFDNSTGVSLGLRASGSVPTTSFRVTGYARFHYVDSKTTGELGAGVDVPISKHLQVALSGIHFTGGGAEPAGVIFLVGLKTRFGI